MPSALYLLPSPMRAPAVQQTGLTSVSSVDQAILQTDGYMTAMNSAVPSCSGLSQADIAAWNGQYAAWQELKTNWQGLKDASNAFNLWGPEMYAASDTLAKVQGYSSTIADFKSKMATAGCGAITPPGSPSPTPTPGSPPGSPSGQSWLCSTFGVNCPTDPNAPQPTDWATTIKWVAIAGIVIAAAVYIGPLVATAVGGMISAHKSESKALEE